MVSASADERVEAVSCGWCGSTHRRSDRCAQCGSDWIPAAEPTAVSRSLGGVVRARAGRRALAGGTDLIVPVLLITLGFWLLRGGSRLGWLAWGGAVAVLVVEALLLLTLGRTPGRWAAGLRSVDDLTAAPVGLRVVTAGRLPGVLTANLNAGRDPLRPLLPGEEPVPRPAQSKPSQSKPSRPKPSQPRPTRSRLIGSRPIQEDQTHDGPVIAAAATAAPGAAWSLRGRPRAAPGRGSHPSRRSGASARQIERETAGRMVGLREPDQTFPATGFDDADERRSADARADLRADVRAGRPTVGLALDGGARVELEHVLLVGRSPVDTDPGPGRRLLALPDLSRRVAKTHVLLEWSGTVLWVSDLGSSTGTFVATPEGTRVSLPPRVRFAAGIGSVIICGGRSLRVVPGV